MNTKALITIKNKAIKEKVPIIRDDTVLFLNNLIKENNIKNILEIGSAVGYSAINFALTSDNIKVLTIEKDVIRYNEALLNIKNMNLDSRITIINDDALNVTLNSKYDLIFIDASKSKNIAFFEQFSPLLNNDGIIVTDNLSFHGLVEDESLIETKNQRNIVKHIKNYIDYLDNLDNYHTKYIDVGDKLSITKRCNHDKNAC